jgi:hypothetical protein
MNNKRPNQETQIIISQLLKTDHNALITNAISEDGGREGEDKETLSVSFAVKCSTTELYPLSVSFEDNPNLS